MRAGGENNSPALRPQTVMGRFLAATSLSQRGVADELGKQIPAGKNGFFRDDEAAIAEKACGLAAEAYFGKDYNVRAVTEFARHLREVWIGDYKLGVIQFEAVLRAAMGETDVDLSGITRPALTNAQSVTASYICRLLKMDEAAVNALMADAEAAVIARGWKPL